MVIGALIVLTYTTFGGMWSVALLDFVHAETRTKYPLHRAPGTSEFKRVSWDFALDRIAELLKADRDKNFVAKNGDLTVNRKNEPKMKWSGKPGHFCLAVSSCSCRPSRAA